MGHEQENRLEIEKDLRISWINLWKEIRNVFLKNVKDIDIDFNENISDVPGHKIY